MFHIVRWWGAVYYKNNRVVGLKTKTGKANVYDAYLSADTVFYENNVWEDNVTVSPTRGKNGLFKAKTGSNQVTRVVRNNQFKMSDNLINSLTEAEKTRLYVVPWDFTVDVSSFIFSDNVIEVYHLTQNEYDKVDVFTFNNNIIRTFKMSYMLINLNPTERGSVLNITNNIIESEDKESGDYFYREFSTSSTLRHKRINFSNNVISMGLKSGFMYAIKTDELIFSGNVIDSISDGDTYLTHQGRIGNLVGTNNKLTARKTGSLFRNSTTFEEVDFSIEVSVGSYNRLDDRVTMSFSPDDMNKNLFVTYDVLSNSQRMIFDFVIGMGIDETGLYATYRDGDGNVQKTYTIGGNGNLPTNSIVGNSINYNLYLSENNIQWLFSTNIPNKNIGKITLKSFS